MNFFHQYFAHPLMLLLLLALPVLAWFKGRRSRQPPAFLYSSVQLVKGIIGITRSNAGSILLKLRWLALALFIIALAQPRFVLSQTRVSASGVDIVVALDLSGSMDAEDEGFELNGQQASRSTAIGSALSTSLNRLRDLKAKSKIVILMTDGVNNSGKIPPLTAAEAAKALGIKVYTIGVGTRGTARIWTHQYDFSGRKIYQQIPVDVDEDTLTKIADMTGAKYYRADSSETLKKIYADIDRLEKTDEEVKKYTQYNELFPWAISTGMFFLLLEAILNHTVWRRLP